MYEPSIDMALLGLHEHEEDLRKEALDLVAHDDRLALHVSVIKDSMDLAYHYRRFPTPNEDLKVIQILGMRTFNAFAASLKLALSGYGQVAALVVRDIWETAFLLDLFRTDPALIERWRFADEPERRIFSPAAVRKALEAQDGFEDKRRAEMYRMFSHLAAHPSMQSALMMRRQKDGDAEIGPFLEPGPLAAVLYEMGRVAVQVGAVIDYFFPETWADMLEPRTAYTRCRQRWLDTFHTPQPSGPRGP